jgi:hypothetical protein
MPLNPAAFDPTEMLRRLGLAGGQPPPGLPDGEYPPPAGGDGLLGQIDFRSLLNSPEMKLAAAKPGAAAPAPKFPEPAAPPPAAPQGPGFFGRLAQDAPAFGQSPLPLPPGDDPPKAGLFAPAAAPQMPAFTPAQLPPAQAYAPTRVEGAVPVGRFNPAGDSPWDRSMTASSPEEELRFRQDAAYNRVLEMIRPGGIGLAGTTGPIVGLQPWEAQAMASLGGRMSGDATRAREITAGERTAESDRQLRALLGNQQAQTQRDIAGLETQSRTALGNLDAQTRRDVAQTEAQSRNNPNTIKLQLAGQYLAANRDPLGLGEFLGSLARHVPDATGALPGGSKGVDTDPIAGGPNLRASQAISSVRPNFGTATPDGGFKLDPTLMRPENLKKLIDTIDSLPDDAKAAAARQIHRGDLGPANDVIDALAKSFANNSLLTERPPTDQGGALPGQYGIVAGGGADPLITLNAMPAGSWLARRAQAVRGANNLPYNQITVAGRSMPFEPSSLIGNRATNLGLGQEQRRVSAAQADKEARFLRLLIDMQKAQNQQPR